MLRHPRPSPTQQRRNRHDQVNPSRPEDASRRKVTQLRPDYVAGSTMLLEAQVEEFPPASSSNDTNPRHEDHSGCLSVTNHRRLDGSKKNVGVRTRQGKVKSFVDTNPVAPDDTYH
jgi:hypothetical protein